VWASPLGVPITIVDEKRLVKNKRRAYMFDVVAQATGLPVGFIAVRLGTDVFPL